MKNGYSYETFAAKMHTTTSTLYDWEKAHPEFSFAKQRAMTYCQEFWERKGIEALETKNFNTALWIFNMKNRFSWRENAADVNIFVDLRGLIEEANARRQSLVTIDIPATKALISQSTESDTKEIASLPKTTIENT